MRATAFIQSRDALAPAAAASLALAPAPAAGSQPAAAGGARIEKASPR